MTTLRLLLASILLCAVAYTGIVLGLAGLIHPHGAQGSLVTSVDGRTMGSRLIAQPFVSVRYFHPRPSACTYNASAAAGSNLSPKNPRLAERAREIIARSGAVPGRPVPADLVSASGSGLDPDITEAAARYQAARVATARGIDPAAVHGLIGRIKRPPSAIPGGPALVNVLELNLALDRILP